MYSVRDLVPWSLIYGAQNERHERELQAAHCSSAATHHALCMAVLDIFFKAPVSDFNDPMSLLWATYWPLISPSITLKDIATAKAAHLSNCTLNHQDHEADSRTVYLSYKKGQACRCRTNT